MSTMTPAKLAQVLLATNRGMDFAEQMHSIEALEYAEAVLAALAENANSEAK